MKKVMALLGAFVLMALTAHAQTPADPSKKLGWDVPGEAVTVAQASGYNLYVDAATTPIGLQSVVCTSGGASGPLVSCIAPFPAMAPGTHTVTLTQTSGTAESGKSTGLSITFVVVVTPQSLRVVP